MNTPEIRKTTADEGISVLSDAKDKDAYQPLFMNYWSKTVMDGNLSGLSAAYLEMFQITPSSNLKWEPASKIISAYNIRF